MSTLIEDIYCPVDINTQDIYKIKIKELSYLDKYILGVHRFYGYNDNNIFDVAFMNRIPLQMIYYRYKFYSMGI